MSSIVMNPHPRTLAEIAIQPIDSHTNEASCGCHERGENRWYLCAYHLGVDEGWSERDDVIKDLTDRIDRGVEELTELRSKVPLTGAGTGIARLNGKIDGLLLVKDWLRSYPSVTEEP